MTNNLWDVNTMKAYGLEAYDTARKLPGRVAPKGASSYWPVYQNHVVDMSLEAIKIKVSLTSEKITRHDDFLSLANRHLEERERKDLLQWFGLKRKEGGENLGRYCDKYGLHTGIYAQRINKIFQKLVDFKNVQGGLLLLQGLENSKEISQKQENAEPMVVYTNHWQDNKKVQITPEEMAATRKRLTSKLLKSKARADKRMG